MREIESIFLVLYVCVCLICVSVFFCVESVDKLMYVCVDMFLHSSDFVYVCMCSSDFVCACSALGGGGRTGVVVEWCW